MTGKENRLNETKKKNLPFFCQSVSQRARGGEVGKKGHWKGTAKSRVTERSSV